MLPANLIIAILFSFILFAPTAALAISCTTGDCHGDVVTAPALHDPVANGECASCHEASEENLARHSKNPSDFSEFSFPEGDGPICLSCHETFTGKNVHSPVAEGECLSCHNPHGGSTASLLKQQKETNVCFECHDNDKTTRAFVHGPLANNECLPCHNPHASDYPYQLTMAPKKLCLECHDDKSEWLDKTSVHAPLTDEGCLPCHDPHGGSNEYFLKASDGGALCATCHSEINPELLEQAVNAKYPHQPAQQGKCISCHSPHASDSEKLLLRQGEKLCLGCHTEMAEQFSTAEYIHGAIEDSGCLACHLAHGSDNPAMGKEPFPDKFYIDYKEGIFNLCFGCHEDIILKDKTTESATNFRNGTTNLHFLHVVKKKKGRSCIACHEPHASRQPLLVRESVPFGNSGRHKLSIAFTVTDTGGTCVVGCHKPKTYDRQPTD